MTFAETISSIFDPIMDPVFGMLLKLPPFWGIFIITFIVTLITTLIYKKMTNQEHLKNLKEEMKDLSKQMKASASDQAKLVELQKIQMQKSMSQLRETTKPMLITMLPILIIFGWFSGHLAYHPILPDTDFNVSLTFKKEVVGNVDIIIPAEIESINGKKQTIENNAALFILKGKEGSYNLNFLVNNQTYSKDLLITKERRYKTPTTVINKDLKIITINNEPIRVFGLSWFWAYLILAIIMNTFLRKLLKVH